MNEKDVDILCKYTEDIVSARTLKSYKSGFRKIQYSLDELKNMGDEKLKQYLNSYIKKAHSGSIRRTCAIWVLDIIKRDDLKRRLLRNVQKERRILKKWVPFSVINQIIQSKDIDDLIKLIIMIQYETAARIGEILNVDLKDIDFENNAITMKIEKSGGIITRAISNTTTDLIKKYIGNRNNGLLFDIKHRKDNYHYIWEKQRKLFKSLGLNDISSHWFRASRAVHLLHKNYDVVTIQELLGHKNLSSTTYYLQASGVRSKEIMNKEEPKW